MNNFIVLFFIFISSAFPSDKNTKADKWEELDALVRNTLGMIANDDFKDAVKSIKKIEKLSDNIFAIDDCLRAALYYKITEEYQTRDFEDDFDESIKRAITVLANEDKDKKLGDIYKAKRLQFLGSAYGYRGMYRTFKGEWGGAFMDGKRASEVLEESYKLDNSLIDNKAGIGTYLYWRSAKAGIVKYLLLWGDKKKEGLSYIKEALEKGSVIKLWSLGGLLRIYMEEKKGKLSIEVTDKILALAPKDTGTLRRRAFVSEKRKNDKDALKTYLKLLELFKDNDNLLVDKKRLNTANAQIDTIYNILRLSKSLKEKIDTEKYIKEVQKLKTRIEPSYSDIKDIAEKVIADRY
jgi:hypothetical protein